MHRINIESPAHIGFDFDGVIADTAGAFLEIAKAQHGFDLDINSLTNFNLEECCEIPKDLIYQIFHGLVKDTSTTVPIEGALETITKLAKMERVHIITARPIAEPVHKWLNRYFSADTIKNISLMAMGDHDQKLPYIKERGISHFVDDRLETCVNLAKNDITPIVFSQPWNRGQHNFSSAKSWKEIEHVLGI